MPLTAKALTHEVSSRVLQPENFASPARQNNRSSAERRIEQVARKKIRKRSPNSSIVKLTGRYGRVNSEVTHDLHT